MRRPRFHAEDQQILDAILQKSVVMATLHPAFRHASSNDMDEVT